MLFQFVIDDESGRRRNGKISGRDLDHARALLIERGFEVVSLEPIADTEKLVTRSTNSQSSSTKVGVKYKPSVSDRISEFTENADIPRRVLIPLISTFVLMGSVVAYYYSPSTAPTKSPQSKTTTQKPIITTLRIIGSCTDFKDTSTIRVSLPEIPYTKEWPLKQLKREGKEFATELRLALKKTPSFCSVEIWSSLTGGKKLAERRVQFTGNPPTARVGHLAPKHQSD